MSPKWTLDELAHAGRASAPSTVEVVQADSGRVYPTDTCRRRA